MEVTENLSNDEEQVVQSATNTVTDVSNSNNNRKRSAVWKEFTELNLANFPDKRKRARCNHCTKILFSESRLGTSNLKRHLSTCTNRSSDLNAGNGKEVDQGVYREKLALAITRHGYPFTWVEHEGNRDDHSYLNETAKPISRNTIKAECLKLHREFKEKVKSELVSISSRICLTSDLWTSCTTKGYLCLTAHYVDNDWRLHSKILNFCHVPPPHTANNLFQSVCSLLKEWGIDKKVFTITLDNASNMGSMQEMLREELTSLLCGGEFFHVRCCAPVLNIIVQDGIKELGDSINKIRESVKYVCGSESRKLKFDESVKFCGLRNSKGLWLDVPTRWNSTFLMLERAIYYRRAFANLTRTDSTYVNYPSSEEWVRVEEIGAILKPFFDITNLFSGTHYPMANLYFLCVWKIQLRIREATLSSNVVIQRMAKEMEEKFNKYWEDYSSILSMAVVFDPRCKMNFVKFFYKKLGTICDHKWEKTQENLAKLFKEYTTKRTRDAPKVVESRDVVVEEIDGDITAFDNFDENLGSSKSQLDVYLEEPRLDLNMRLDVLNYWKKKGLYPELAAMARDILSIPITIVASESAFSMGGRVLNKWRSYLLPENTEALITTPYANDMDDGTKVLWEEFNFFDLSNCVESEFVESFNSNGSSKVATGV